MSPTFRFYQFGLKLDQRALDGQHRCAVQSKLRRPRAALQLQLALLQALAMLSAAGLVDRVTRYAIETQAQNGLPLLVKAGDALGHSRALHRGAAG